MRLRLPLALLLCLALVATLAVPAVADGPDDGSGLSAQALWLTRASSQPWQRSYVDADATNDLGAAPSIAIDQAGGATYVAFRDATSGSLVVATRVPDHGNCGSAADWHCYPVLTVGSSSPAPSIAINPVTGRPGIAFYNSADDQLEYAQYICAHLCTWVTFGVQATDPSDPAYISLAYDSNGMPHIAYHVAWFSAGFYYNGLAYAHNVDSGGNCGVGGSAGMWQCDRVATTSSFLGLTGQYPSIAVDSGSQPRIAYYNGVAHALTYAWKVGSGGNCGPSSDWQCITVDNSGVVGQFASLSYTSGKPQIAYYDSTLGNLKYAIYYGNLGHNCGPSSGWQCDAIDAVGAGATVPISLAVEGNGSTSYPYEPVVAYYDASGANGVLKTARPILLAGNCGPTITLFGYTWNTWQCDTIDGGLTSPAGALYPTAHNVGYGLSIAANATGLATVAYYDASAMDLLSATQRYVEYLPLQLRGQSQP